MRAPPQEIRTARLLLRRWRPSDRAPFARLNGDQHTMRFFVQTRTRAESDESAARFDGRFEAEGMGPWAVEVPGQAAFIGMVGCWLTPARMPFAPAVEAAWRILPEHWGRGYAPEAARAAFADVFARCGASEIVACTAAGNLPSRSVMTGLGMTHDPAEDFDHPTIAAGHPLRRHVLTRITAERFRARYPAAFAEVSS